MHVCFRFAKWNLALGLVVFCLSCSDDSETNHGKSADVQIGVHHVAAQDTMLEVSLQFDGVEIDRFSSNSGTEPVGLSGIVANVQSGSHEIKVTIIRQTSSPNPYLFNGSVFFDDRQIQIDQPFPQATLSDGESLSAFVDL